MKMISAALVLVAALASAAAVPVTIDLNASAAAIVQHAATNTTDGRPHKLPKMLDTSRMRLRNVNKAKMWSWEDCSVEGSSVQIREITVVPCVPPSQPPFA